MQPRTSESLLHHLQRRCDQRARRLAAALAWHPGDADELVQEAYLVAVRKAEAVPLEGPWPWFANVIIGLARNMRRRYARDADRFGAPAVLDELAQQDPAADPVLAAQHAELMERIATALTLLPEAQRAVVLLRCIDGHSRKEAAALLRTTATTVDKRLSRGLKRLRELLDLDNENERPTLLHSFALLGGAATLNATPLTTTTTTATTASLAKGVALMAAAGKTNKMITPLIVLIALLLLGFFVWQAQTPTDTNDNQPGAPSRPTPQGPSAQGPVSPNDSEDTSKQEEADNEQDNPDAEGQQSAEVDEPSDPTEEDPERKGVPVYVRATLSPEFPEAATHVQIESHRLGQLSGRATLPRFVDGSVQRDAVPDTPLLSPLTSGDDIEFKLRDIYLSPETWMRDPRGQILPETSLEGFFVLRPFATDHSTGKRHFIPGFIQVIPLKEAIALHGMDWSAERLVLSPSADTGPTTLRLSLPRDARPFDLRLTNGIERDPAELRRLWPYSLVDWGSWNRGSYNMGNAELRISGLSADIAGEFVVAEVPRGFGLDDQLSMYDRTTGKTEWLVCSDDHLFRNPLWWERVDRLVDPDVGVAVRYERARTFELPPIELDTETTKTWPTYQQNWIEVHAIVEPDGPSAALGTYDETSKSFKWRIRRPQDLDRPSETVIVYEYRYPGVDTVTVERTFRDRSPLILKIPRGEPQFRLVLDVTFLADVYSHDGSSDFEATPPSIPINVRIPYTSRFNTLKSLNVSAWTNESGRIELDFHILPTGAQSRDDLQSWSDVTWRGKIRCQLDRGRLASVFERLQVDESWRSMRESAVHYKRENTQFDPDLREVHASRIVPLWIPTHRFNEWRDHPRTFETILNHYGISLSAYLEAVQEYSN